MLKNIQIIPVLCISKATLIKKYLGTFNNFSYTLSKTIAQYNFRISFCSDHEFDDINENKEYHENQQQHQQQLNTFKCVWCENSFLTNDERTQHVQEMHMPPLQQSIKLPSPVKNDSKKYKCRVCLNRFVSTKVYINHLKSEHSDSDQINEILKKLSESSMNGKHQQNKSNNNLHDST